MPAAAEPVLDQIDPKQRNRPRQGWCVPRTIRRFGEKLMSQQVWCWGRDIECSDGNLLMRYGFERYRESNDLDHSTCYRWDQNEMHVCLWGFGMFFGSRKLGGLFLNRFEFCPVWAPVESVSLDIYWPDELPVFKRPKGEMQWLRAQKLWRQSLTWIAEYESWIREGVGVDYRRQCVQSWMRPHVRAEKKAAAWRFLSRYGWEHESQSLHQALRRFTITPALK
ncbi:MAG: hypothetical protein AAF539_06375 [Planctomycetota bacterium]